MKKLTIPFAGIRYTGHVVGFMRYLCPHVITTKELARASIRLNMDIDMKDNHQLYVESAAWLGVPYRGGGNSKRGVDCSGLTSHLYKKVYHKKAENVTQMTKRTQDCHKVSKRKLARRRFGILP